MQVPLGDTYYFLFTTRSFSTGAPATLGGTPVLSVYEENNLTQITSGVSVSADYDSVTGLNQATVVATSGNGYEVGKYYNVVITTGTVSSVSVVGEVVGHFRIMPAEDAGAGIPDVNVTHVGDSAQDISTATALATAQADLDTITGADGATLATAQGNYAPSVAGDSMALTAAAIDAIWDEATAGHVSAGTTGKALVDVLADTNELQTDDVPGLIAALNDLSAAAVNAEVVDALATDTYAEPGQGTPGATISLAAKINYIYKFLRNRVTTTSTTISVYNDDAITVDHKSTHSDDGSTYDRGEFTTGP